MRLTSRMVPLTAIVAAVVGLASNIACTSHMCNALYAPDQVSIQRTVGASLDASKPLHVELCRNDVCQGGDFVPGSSNEPSQRLCLAATESLHEDGCAFRKLEGDSWEFRAYWDVTNESPTNGDRYRVTLTSSGVVILSVDARATYVETEPNGEDCGINRSATL